MKCGAESEQMKIVLGERSGKFECTYKPFTHLNKNEQQME